jgi:dipeptidyl-peptidase-4
MYQYSGPGSQQVNNEWNSTDDYWFMMLSQQDILSLVLMVVELVLKRAAFKVTQLQLGKYEVEDQIDAAKVIGNYSFVDKNRYIWLVVWRIYVF